ncbi:MAG: glycosyltransferase [Dongiaceae bacterium]
MSAPYLSVVIPVYNEQEVLPILFNRLLPVLDGLGKSFEVIFTNDGSKDKTSQILAEYQAKRPSQIRVIEFLRNYGQHPAIMAGFELAKGEVIVTLDADLQNPPEEIPKLLEFIDKGHDVAGGCRQNRQDTAFRKMISKASNIVRDWITPIRLADHGCMLRAYRRHIVELILASHESSTFIPALAQYFAANPVDVPVKHEERAAGASKYNLFKLIRYNFDLMTAFSLLPLQVFTIVGMVLSAASGLLVVYMIGRRLIIGPEAEGIFTLFAIVFLLIGVLMTGTGLIGEYVGRIYQEVRRRPRYAIRQVLSDRTDSTNTVVIPRRTGTH